MNYFPVKVEGIIMMILKQLKYSLLRYPDSHTPTLLMCQVTFISSAQMCCEWNWFSKIFKSTWKSKARMVHNTCTAQIENMSHKHTHTQCPTNQIRKQSVIITLTSTRSFSSVCCYTCVTLVQFESKHFMLGTVISQGESTYSVSEW